MKFAIIENGVVVNVSASDVALADNWVAAESANIGDLYENGQFISYDPKTDPIATAAQATFVRQQRTEKIKDSDWTQLPDAPADKVAWAAYRQALRDVTAQTGFPWAIDWPTQP